MAVAIKFDANQQYQRDAIDSVVELFAGQEAVEQGVADAELRDEETLEGFHRAGLRQHAVARRPRRCDATSDASRTGPSRTRTARAARDPRGAAHRLRAGEVPLDFSVEMETGTGKTYVYLRTIAELHQKYGFTKFVIVVPSVAIREGVLSSLRLLKEHIRELYDGLQYDSYVYDSSAPHRVRQFATASHLQIMVINIDCVHQGRRTIIHRPTDAMNGYAPIEFLRACRPIVIMDEPQSMETPIRQEAIASLSPLFRLRLLRHATATCKHLVYRLTPVDAYDLRLVKRIGVLSITKDDDLNEAYVEVAKINATPGGVTATAKIHKATQAGHEAHQVTLRKDDDLFELSGERERLPGLVGRGHPRRPTARRYVEFGNGRTVREGVVGPERGRPAAAAHDPPGHREPLREGAPAPAAAAPQASSRPRSSR